MEPSYYSGRTLSPVISQEMPELSCRQMAAWITDNQGFSVSESSVYRILGREGLVKRPEMRLAAGKESTEGGRLVSILKGLQL